jgi:hypothetical protein
MTSTPLVIAGATLIDGVADEPLEHASIWIENGRIGAIGRSDERAVPAGAACIDARGKFVIPGLMNANVHLLCDVRLENLARYIGRYEELIVEAAQVALKNGLTTVFDTWGPRRFLIAARDRINAGEIPGSRFFCAGNIVGFDGPFSADFFGKTADVASAAFVNRINSIWVENVGRHLMWLSPEDVAREVRAYIGKGIDFVKYGSNEHPFPGAFLAFSPQVQASIVGEAHRAARRHKRTRRQWKGCGLRSRPGAISFNTPISPGPCRSPGAHSMRWRSAGRVQSSFHSPNGDWIGSSRTSPTSSVLRGKRRMSTRAVSSGLGRH